MDKSENPITSSTPIDVLLYIALSEEFDGITDILNRELGASFKPCELDDLCLTIYYGCVYSPVQDRKIRLAVVPAGKMGVIRAASVTSAILARSIVRNVVVLGIAGALSKDLQPGDVFIPDSVNEYLANSATRDRLEDTNKTNLCCEYLTNSANQNKPKQWFFETSGNHYPTSPRLLNSFQSFKNSHPELFKQWLDGCEARFSEVATPSVRQELAKADLKLRYKPVLVAGDDKKLASGPAVGKGYAFVQWLKTSVDRKVAALEMESSGVYDAVHIRDSAPRIMAIRGISDIADEKKEMIEKKTNGGFRSVSIINALYLLIFGIRAGLFSHKISKEGLGGYGILAGAGTRESIIQGPDPSATGQTDTPDNRNTQNVVYDGKSKQIIRECLDQSFSDRQDIINFCYEFDRGLYKNLRDGDNFDTIVNKIRQHCHAHNCHDRFWRTFEEERPKQFIKYYTMWNQMID